MQFTHEREFTYTRTYRGPIRAVILDWAGTTMDFGCMAPAVVFQKVYEKAGVPISMEEARLPMGAHKKVHIGLIAQIPSVRRHWIETHGTEPADKDVDRMFEDFVPMQEACLSDYSTLIPGTLEVVAECRKRGYKIGSTSGYLPGMLAINQADADLNCDASLKRIFGPDLAAGADRLEAFLQDLGIGTRPEEHGVKADEWRRLVEEALAGDRGRNFLGDPESVLGRL